MQERLLEWIPTKVVDTGKRTPETFRAVIQVQTAEDVEEAKNYIGRLETELGESTRFTVIQKTSSATALAMQTKKDDNAVGAWQI
jgi:hypothetical protein